MGGGGGLGGREAKPTVMEGSSGAAAGVAYANDEHVPAPGAVVAVAGAWFTGLLT
jgi:hypothetical protein